MADQQSPRHVFLNARVLAALCLVGLGGTFGLSLLTARILPYLGFVIVAGCAGCVFWLYAKHLRAANRALLNRKSYYGPAPLELFVSAGAALLMVGVAGAVLAVTVGKEPPSGRALLEATGNPEFIKLPTDAPTGFVNVALTNAGQLEAQEVRVLLTGHAVPTANGVSLQALNKELDFLEKASEVADKNKIRRGMQAQVRPNNGTTFTLAEVPEDQWPAVLAGGTPARGGPRQLTDDDWLSFQHGKLAIYVLYVARYEDEGHPNAFWFSRNCMYFLGAVKFRHECGDNKIELKNGSR
jgi:hypothetical protein